MGRDQDKFEETRQHQYRDTIKAWHENISAYTILWIDTLLPTAISDYLKNAIRLILVPYLMNIKRLSFEKAFAVIKDWLDKCRWISLCSCLYSGQVAREFLHHVFFRCLFIPSQISCECYLLCSF
jgi:hypothetical protein